MSVVETVVFEDVEGIRVGRFKGKINTTCWFYRIGRTLIDTGPPNQWKWVKNFIEERQIERVVITHHHEDHSGNGARIVEEFKIPIYAPPSSIPYLQNGYKVHLYRQVVWGRPLNFKALPTTVPLEVGEGMSIQLIPTPGHSEDMHCLLIPERQWLFTGDLFISESPQYARVDENPLQEMESIRNILEHNFRILFCGHRGVVENGYQALAAKLNYLQQLQIKAEFLYQNGHSLNEITYKLLGKERGLSLITGFHFTKKNLIKKLLEAES
ncbi:MAG: MBL fold metallo-hydrolase [Calditrichaeota bacterium]|nr:MAG: MBL fold metallo-hydrolase [Calditrichota bacterium]